MPMIRVYRGENGEFLTTLDLDVEISLEEARGELRYQLSEPIAKPLLDLLAQYPDTTHLDVMPTEAKTGNIKLNGQVYPDPIFGVVLS